MIFQTARSNLHHGSNAAEPQLQHPEYWDASPCHGGGPDDCAQRTGIYPQLEVLHVVILLLCVLSARRPSSPAAEVSAAPPTASAGSPRRRPAATRPATCSAPARPRTTCSAGEQHLLWSRDCQIFARNILTEL